jgi:hypothetical protein
VLAETQRQMRQEKQRKAVEDSGKTSKHRPSSGRSGRSGRSNKHGHSKPPQAPPWPGTQKHSTPEAWPGRAVQVYP